MGTRAAGAHVDASVADEASARTRIEGELRRFVERLDTPASLRDAIAYALLGGGKRVRPMLAWRACEAMGAAGEHALPACLSVELIHAFSLVHDDLPAIDNDDLRRGRPTLHRHAGEAMAILAGDAMLTLAVAPLVDEGIPAALSARLVREVVSGTMGMIEGQVYDTLGGLDEADPGRAVELIHARKTGALIVASVRMGAMLAGRAGVEVREPDLDALTRFGRDLGLLFQIVDDLIDVQQHPEHAGKATGKDAAAGKRTFPSTFGVETSRARAAELEASALSAIAGFGSGADGLRAMARGMSARTR
ncbi:MAG: polyprenyl synthetase family protein [Phycisphaerales bacterium]|jgi:geranylgeranyl diphosphate synthase type II|nr:polyprenyl synthetase family protein [Phycisphaerales bacterium]